VKTQRLVKGARTVPSDLPSHVRQGLFATPGSYPVAARYANEPNFRQDDEKPGPRSMAIKIFNVKGERLEGQGKEIDNTQDFFYNNAPVLELTEVDACLEIMQYRKNTFIILRVCLLYRR